MTNTKTVLIKALEKLDKETETMSLEFNEGKTNI